MKANAAVLAPAYLKWRQLNDRLTAEVGRDRPLALAGLRLLEARSRRRGVAPAEHGDPRLQAHAEAIATAWRRLYAERSCAGVYGTLVRHAHRAFERGDQRQATAILKSVGQRHGTPAAPVDDTLRLLLLGVLSVQGGRHEAALCQLAPLDFPGDAAAQALLHHLTGVCHARAARWQRALAHLELGLIHARDTGHVVLVGHVLVDLALAQARLASTGLPATLAELDALRAQTGGALADTASRASLRRHLCSFAGSGHVTLIDYFLRAAMEELPPMDYWSTADFPPLYASRGPGPLLEAMSGTLSLIDQFVDLTGVAGVLFPKEEALRLGLAGHPLYDHPDLVGLTEQWSVVYIVINQVGRNPHVAEAALSAGRAFCMVWWAVRERTLALYASLCLDAIARLRGRVSMTRAALALQRGFFMLQAGRAADARDCFGFARQLVLDDGMPWRPEMAQALLGIGLCDHLAGRSAAARQRLWKAYVMARISSDSASEAWRCASALSQLLAPAAGAHGAARLRERHSALLLDKLAIGQMLAALNQESSNDLNFGEWFPALRQAIATLVGLRRLTEAEGLRDLARSVRADRLVPAAARRGPPMAGVLSEDEHAALQAAGVPAVEQRIAQLRALVAAHGGDPRDRSAAMRDIAQLWTRLPGELEQGLDRAAGLLAVEGASVRPADPVVRAPNAVAAGRARLGYLVQSDRLVITLEQPGERFHCDVTLSDGELWKAVFAARAACSDAKTPLDAARHHASVLYRLLLAPVRERLARSGAGVIEVAPHEFLDHVPFAALWDGECFMAERFAWLVRHPHAVEPAAALQDDWPADAAVLRLLGVSEFGAANAPLAGVARELDRIRADAGVRARLWLNAEVTAQAVAQAFGVPGAGVVHIATHAGFDALDDSKSVLQLGDGSTMSVSAIRELIAAHPLRLLVLAACSTAKKAPARDSIASAFLRTGVRSVMATQWPLNDASSAWLMPLFYRRLFAGRLSPAEALREAQCLFMQGDLAAQRWPDDPPDLALPSAEERLHPRLWSPYTLFE